MRSGIDDNRLVMKSDDEEGDEGESQILCSMGLFEG